MGEAYSRLYVTYGDDVFAFRDAAGTLSLDDGMAKATLSGLHRKGVLAIFSRGRPRLYSLVTPDVLIMLASGKIKRAEVKQERYQHVIYGCLLELSGMLDLTSLAIYGSVARGTASDNSDLDLLVVSQDFKGSLAERIDALAGLKNRLHDEFSLLRRHGVNASLSLYPLRREEVERLPIILLDITEEGRIAYDKDGFLQKNLTRLRLKLADLGSKRVPAKDGWYWDLKPDYRALEVVNL